jgi:hypothetical protein
MFVELKKSFLGRAAGERIDVSETDAQHLIQQQTAVAVDDDLIGPAVTRALDAALARQSQSIDAAVNQALKAFGEAKSLSRKHAVPALFAATATTSKSITAVVSSSMPARRRSPRPLASPAAIRCRPTSTNN